MSARSFLDTNVLVYTDDKAAPAKQRIALDLVAAHRRAQTGVVSLQVLQEYFVTITRKLHVDPQVARRKVELLAEFDVASPDVGDILAAIDLHRLHGFSFWDGWCFARPSRRAAPYSYRRICRIQERSMACGS